MKEECEGVRRYFRQLWNVTGWGPSPAPEWERERERINTNRSWTDFLNHSKTTDTHAIKHDFLLFGSYEKDSSPSKNTESACSCASWPMKALLFSYGKHMSVSVVRKLVTVSESLHQLQPITLSAKLTKRELVIWFNESQNCSNEINSSLYADGKVVEEYVCWCLCGVRRTAVLAGQSLIRNPCDLERDPPDKRAQPDAHRHDFIRGHTRAKSGANPQTHTTNGVWGGGERKWARLLCSLR